MSITMGSNISSLQAQRAFADATKQVGSASERLASGMRINKASDDAAGLAISEQLNSDAKVFNQGIRNINDGLSVTNIAESAIEELSGIVIRIRELATQSANGSISNTQRASIDEEAQALSDEYTRIVSSTEFNDMKLLDGSTKGIRVQAGYGLEGSIDSGDRLVTTGDGTFTKDATYTTGDEPRSIALGDMNGDGITDMVVANRGSDDVTLHIGNGNGTFVSAVTIPTGDYAHSVDLGDLNNDGILDLATANHDGNDITVRFGIDDGSGNNGNGTFTPVLTIAAEIEAMAIAFADFDGDGNLDIVSGNQSGSASVVLGNGNGTFDTAVSYSTGGSTRSVQTGDINNDGILDIVTANFGSSSVSILLGNESGDGTFAGRTTIASGGGDQTVSLGDLNNDGNLDMVTADLFGSSATIHLGNGDGTFQAATSRTFSDLQNTVALADLNGDGTLDMLLGGRNSMNVLEGNGNGTFKAATSYAVSGDVRAVAIGDLNGDGALDIMGSGNDQVAVFMGGTRQIEESVFSVDLLNEFTLANRTGALEAMGQLEEQLETLTSQRGSMGAFQSRLEVANNVLQVSTENFSAAESRIKDADIASEAANLVRTQILQQASSAVLAQANQQPSLALTLLQS